MSLNSPIPLERVLGALDLAELGAGDLVVDVGCGSGALLQALAPRGIRGLGIDTDASVLPDATDAFQWRCADASTVELPQARLVVLLGSTHAYGSGRDALTSALAAAKDAELVLVGEGYQRQPLPEPYAALLGTPHGLERTHAENVADCEAAGFGCLHAITATRDDWDAFEWGFYRRQVAAGSGDRARRWRDAYLRWGRETMGFGLYLLRRG